MNAKDCIGFTALMCVNEEEKNAVDMARLLIAGGADVNATYGVEKTVLMLAVERATTWAWRLIKSFESTGDYYRKTAHIYAAYNNALAIVRLLIEAGADVNAKRYDGKTALMYATEGNATEVMELLKAAGASF